MGARLGTALALMASIMLWAGVGSAFADTPVAFPDANLNAAVHTALGLEPGDPVMASRLATLTTLVAQGSNVTTLDGLEYATGLVSLDLSDSNITTITPLASLTKLQWLEIDNNHISDVTALGGLHDLTYLKLTFNKVSDLTPLSADTSLTTLYAASNKISDVSPVTALTRLTRLDLGDNNISNVAPLGGSLPQIEELALNNNQISDLTGLGNHPTLRDLGIGANQVSSLSELASDPGLVMLRAYDNQIDSIQTLESLPDLQELWLGYNHVANISPLHDLIHLHYLDLRYNQTSDVTPLVGLPLHQLFLTANPIGSVTPLAGLVTLERLEVAACGISDISSLSGLTQMSQLDLAANPRLTSINAVAPMSLLTTISASSCGIYDLEPLRNKPHLARADFAYNDVWDISPLKDDPIVYPWFVGCWIDFTPGGEADQVMNGWVVNNHASPAWQYNLYQQRVPGELAVTVQSNGLPLSGVTMKLATGQTATTAANGAALIARSPTGERRVAFSKPYYHTLVTTVTVTEADTTRVGVSLAPVKLHPTLTRKPSAASLGFRRSRGVARFTLRATIVDARGPVAGAPIQLQRSLDGKHWSVANRLVTKANGGISYVIATYTTGLRYYRWFAPTTAADFSAATTKLAVRIR